MARPTIAQLEAILENEEQVEIEILPNGEVRAKAGTSAQQLRSRKPREQCARTSAASTAKRRRENVWQWISSESVEK